MDKKQILCFPIFKKTDLKAGFKCFGIFEIIKSDTHLKITFPVLAPEKYFAGNNDFKA